LSAGKCREEHTYRVMPQNRKAAVEHQRNAKREKPYCTAIVSHLVR